MSRLKLNQVYAPRTVHLVLFEREFEGLNDFYWMFGCASALMSSQAIPHRRVTDFIPQPEAGHLDITTAVLADLMPKTALIARHGLLVQVITYYEVYLQNVLSDLIRKKWPGSRQVTLKIRPSDLPQSNVDEFIKNAAIVSEVKSVIDDGYSKRGSRIKNLFISSGYAEPPQDSVRNNLVNAACEARNCIVHAGGKVDQRALDALHPYSTSLAINDQLDLNEHLMWRFLGAVRDDARAIDYALRKPASEINVRRSAKQKRYVANRKAKNLEAMSKHKNKP